MNTAQTVLLVVALTCHVVAAVVGAVYLLQFNPEPDFNEAKADEWNPV